MDEKILLLWDDFSGHWTKEVVDYATAINIVLMKVPPRYTYVCQPADVAWNQPFKSRLRARWLDLLSNQILNHHALERDLEEQRRKVAVEVAAISRAEIQEVAREKIRSLHEQILSSKFEMVAPKRVDIASLITESRKELSSKTIIAGFAKAGLLCDVRVADEEDINSDSSHITDPVTKLNDLGVVGQSVDSDDEYASSDASDNDLFS
ncbi:DDE superfamily endonuclease [Phytophthora infestans]|uniref:DDE superfamily endonuclease n=1 Tax=Phytophthora infestans TaxID=4787 RepID=A0A8S9V5I0_PHYIN|nr:DDE superfamily endonuclease [Phytophthora infestans]